MIKNNKTKFICMLYLTAAMLLLLVPSITASYPIAGTINITPSSITNSDAVTMSGICTDSDGASDLRSCQFVDGIGGSNVYPVGTLQQLSNTSSRCFWQGTSFSGYTGDLEYRLACTDRNTTVYGPYNENTTIKRDTLLAGEVSVSDDSVTATNLNFVSVSPHFSRRLLAIYGQSGDGRPSVWQHAITTTLPSSPSTLGWYVCEGRVDSCNCAPKATSTGANRSVQWTADSSYNGTEFETLCWQTNTAPHRNYYSGTIQNQTLYQDTPLLNAFDLDSYFVDDQNDSLVYSITGLNQITAQIGSSNLVSFYPAPGFTGTETAFFTAIDSYNASSYPIIVEITVLPADTLAPNVTLTLSDDDNLVSGTLTIIVQAFDTFLDSISIYINNILVQTCDAILPQSVCSYTFDTSLVGDGLYTITGAAVDTSGNTASDSETITADNTAPSISSDLPEEISYTSDLLLLYNVTDANGINSTNATFNNQVVSNNQTVSNLAPGNYTLTVRSRDRAGNGGSSSATVVVVDDVPPVITITSPNSSQYINTQSLTFIFSVSDERSSVSSTSAQLDSNLSIINNQTVLLSNLSLGSHTFIVTALDAPGNTASASFTFEIIPEDSDGDGFVDSDDCAPFDANINPDAAETCDGIDNNCNLETDENLTIESGTDAGTCQLGIQMCTNGTYIIVQEEIFPTLELCDGLDNDCDGDVPTEETDEDNDSIMMCQNDNCPSAYNPDQLDADSDSSGNACDFELNLNSEQLWITPEVLNVNPGVLTVHTSLPAPFDEAVIENATLDGAPMERVSGPNINFEREAVQLYLEQINQTLDIYFEVRGTLQLGNLTYTFVGNDSISEIQE